MKTSANQIAGRYVKALFDAAKGDALGAVEKDFAVLAYAYRQSDEFAALLANPLLSRDQQKDAIAAVLKSIKAHEMTGRFLALLVETKRLPILPEIMRIFADRAAEARGEMKAEVASAAPLEARDIAAIGERLGKSFGKKVIVEARQDESLLGGFVVKIGSLQLDSSLSGKINRLKLALKAA